jgi:hypothetical protein
MPTVNERDVDFVSKRLHNYEYNPVWVFLADQAGSANPGRSHSVTRQIDTFRVPQFKISKGSQAIQNGGSVRAALTRADYASRFGTSYAGEPAGHERRRKYLDPAGDFAQNIQIGARQVTTTGPLGAARGQSRCRGTRGRSPDDPNAPRSPR